MHRRIGKYHVIREAGSGGFGAVYEGYDAELDRNVAIKICATGDESHLERFRREARIVSGLKHRNIALVYDFGYDAEAGVHYLVEEFLSGVDLEKKIKERDRLPASLRLRYLIGIVHGLAFVHDNGLIHRDLTPGNVRVQHDHTIKIMDFGLAKDVTDSTLTLVGDNFGTVGYTAPEQLSGMHCVDLRTDVFSFGVIAYELLSFTNPFMTDSMGEFLHAIHRRDPRPIVELWPECPPLLAMVVHKCMEKAPEKRFGSCAEFLPILKATLKQLRGRDVPAAYAPPPAVTAEARPVAATQASPAFPGGSPVPPATWPDRIRVPLPRGLRPRHLFFFLAVVGLLALALAVLRPEGPPPESAGGRAAAREPASPPPPAAKQASAASLPVFVLRSQSSGTPEKPAIQLLATVPGGIGELSHCYVLRTPPWNSGETIRRDCVGEAFRHLDRVDVRPGEHYTYRVEMADAAGQTLARSLPTSLVAGDRIP